jgi:hypothetical protein
MKEAEAIAEIGDHMLVPYLREHCFAGHEPSSLDHYCRHWI